MQAGQLVNSPLEGGFNAHSDRQLPLEQVDPLTNQLSDQRLFGGKVVVEDALSNVGTLGDICYTGAIDALFATELHRGAKKGHTGFVLFSLAATRSLHSYCDQWSLTTEPSDNLARMQDDSHQIAGACGAFGCSMVDRSALWLIKMTDGHIFSRDEREVDPVNVRIPSSTYRLQLHAGFGFADAEAVLDYLEALGITDLYVSPVLTARRGSKHGYDVVDPGHVNPELGGESGLRSLAEALRQRGMGLLLDIVPNHMCVADEANLFWADVLENGPSSPYARYFDIDWSPPTPELAGKVLLPILGDQYGVVLERQELQVRLEEGAFVLRYFDRSLPLAPRSWIRILERALELMLTRGPEALSGATLLESILTGLGYLPTRGETHPERVRERRREKEVLKGILEGQLNKEIAQHLNLSVRTIEQRRRQVFRKLSFEAANLLLKEFDTVVEVVSDIAH